MKHNRTIAIALLVLALLMAMALPLLAAPPQNDTNAPLSVPTQCFPSPFPPFKVFCTTPIQPTPLAVVVKPAFGRFGR